MNSKATRTITLLAGETFNGTVVPESGMGNERGFIATAIQPVTVMPTYEARREGNAAGLKQDRSTTGIYSAGSNPATLSGYADGRWDIVKCVAGVIEVTLEPR